MIKNLKKLRKTHGISQQHLGEIIGVSQQSVNKYENHNIEPDIYTLSRIAKYFNTSIDYLVGNTEINHVIEEVHPYDLNDNEISLVESYRKLSDSEKESILMIQNNYLNNRK